MPDFEIEEQYPNEIIYGIDEAGLGSLAGPIVVVSCCFFNKNLSSELLLNINDSKKLTKKKREYLFEKITNNTEIKYGISVIESKIIDEIGLSNAWKKGIRDSVNNQMPSICLIDGSRIVDFPNGCNSISIVKGDQKSLSIAAASIIAKVTRDKIMEKIHEKFPVYGFNKHVGYGTKFHIEQLLKNGPCEIHRKSYSPVKLAIKNLSVVSLLKTQD